MKKLVIISLLLCLAACQGANVWRKVMGFGCTDEKIEIKDKIGQCKCQDGSQCIWTDDKPIMGCPCQTAVKNPQQLTCVKQAQKFGCGTTKLECSTNFGQCTCPDNSQCVWAKDKEIMGCPCGSGKQPNFAQGAKMASPNDPENQPHSRRPKRTQKYEL
ncbi:hypothetical protein ABPG72_019048 [Tetrahymena utriculariae]